MPLDNRNSMDGPVAADREVMKLLQAEVEQLQFELAERDAQLTELGCLDTDEQGGTDEGDDTLLVRLEDLLSELERTDERAALLEQVLQVSEEKNRADQEERRHLAAWVNDIEQRLGEREGEWHAERDALTHRIQCLTSDRDELMDQLRQRCAKEGDSDGSPDAGQLRMTNLKLREQLQEAQERCLGLDERVRERDNQLSARSEAETALREEHLKLAQERAAVARQQAELTAAQTHLEQAPHRPETEIDCRLREFRAHLREIHSEERQNPQKMSSRLSRLWARIEGN